MINYKHLKIVNNSNFNISNKMAKRLAVDENLEPLSLKRWSLCRHAIVLPNEKC